MRASRRSFLGAGLAGASFLVTGTALRAAAQSHAVSVLRGALELGRRLRGGELSPLAWQDAMEATLRAASVDELRDAIGLELLRGEAPRVRRGAAVQLVPLTERLDPDEGAAMRVFFFHAGRTDPPHCHFNMVTAHVVLAGRFRVRHFERLAEGADHFVIRPSRDREIGPGEATSISDLRENGHWHAALTDGVLLDVEQGRLDPSVPPRRRQMMDPTVAAAPDGTIRAPFLARGEALRRFG